MSPTLTSCLVSALLLAPAQGTAPAPGGRGPCGQGAPAACRYDASSEVSLQGAVEAVELKGPRAMGVRVKLKGPDGPLWVHLGPAWFLRAGGLDVAAGDTVEVTGSRVSVDGQPAVLARTVRKGGQALTLRDAQGVPAWAGHGRGRMAGRVW